MAETALAFALKKAGLADEALLRTLAEAELRKAKNNVFRALGPFVDEVRDAGGILSKLHPYAETRDRARAYLEVVAFDMSGEGLKVPAKAGDGVQIGSERHEAFGPVDNSEGEGSLRALDDHRRHGPSSSDSVPSRDGGGVQSSVANQSTFGSPESREGEAVRRSGDSRDENGPSSSHQVRDGAVQKTDVGQSPNGRVIPIPNKPRGLEAMKARAEVHSIFDSYKTRDGIPIGDVVWSALPRLESANAQEAALLKLIREHVSPVGNPNARVRDLIKLEDLQRMIQKVAEISNG